MLGEGARDRRAASPARTSSAAATSGPVFDLADGGPADAFRVLAGDFVTTEDGTGLVHIAPAFGEDDYAVAAANGIFDPTEHGTLYNPVGLDGTFDRPRRRLRGPLRQGPRGHRGADRRPRARAACSSASRSTSTPTRTAGAAARRSSTTPSRAGTSPPRRPASSCSPTTRQIGWHPEHIKHGRFGKWLENNVDWALSRDRYWGTPLPIWECAGEDCDGRFCAGSVAELRERAARRGARRPAPPLHRRGRRSTASSCGGEMRRVESVIDTWYDSGAMPFAQFHYPFENEELFEERFPADFICEAIDQTRGWFYTLLAESTLLFDTSSYRNCVCLGLILDPEGQKMSKSKGNVVEPWDVISAHGADAFRWYYLTAQQPWSGYRFSVDTVGESVRQFLLTLWNTYSFWVLYANAEDLGPADFARPIAASPADDLDRWALSRLQATIATVRERMDEFDCTAAGRAIAEYVEELSNWYVRLSRRRFWEGDRAAFATLRHCLLETAALLAPFTPFLADEIHLNLAGGEAEELGELPDSVHLRDFPEPDAALADPELEAAMEAVRLTVELGRAARAQAKAKVRQPLRRAVIVANDAEREAIEARADLVTAELNVKELDFVSEEARAGQLRGQAQLPLARPALRQADAAGRRRGRGARPRPRRRGDGRRAARSGSTSTATSTRSAPTRSPSPCSRWRATRSRPRPATPSPCSSSSTTSCAARASPARSSTPSRTPAKRPAWRSPTAFSWVSAATRCFSAARRTRTTSPGRSSVTSASAYDQAEGRPSNRTRSETSHTT